MAVTAYTSDDLLTRVKARAQVPGADDRLSDSDILAIADDAIRSTVGRIVWNADDGHLVRTQALQAIAADVSDYRIPDRAMSSAVYDVLYVNAAGDEWSLPYLDSAEAWRLRNDAIDVSEGAGRYRYTIEGDVVRLLPTPTQAQGSLRIKYRRRASRLVTVAECAPLTAAGASTLTGTIPSAWSSPITLDVVRGGPSGDSIEDDVACTFSGSTITRSSGTWDTSGAYAPGSGDYACQAGETCVLPVPEEAVPFLTVLVALEVLIVLGDGAAIAAMQQLVAGRRRELVSLLEERSREDVAIIPRHSHLRSHRRSAWQGTD